MSDVAKGPGINANLLTRWKTEFSTAASAAFPGNGNPSANDEQIRRLRRELPVAPQSRRESELPGDGEAMACSPGYLAPVGVRFARLLLRAVAIWLTR